MKMKLFIWNEATQTPKGNYHMCSHMRIMALNECRCGYGCQS